MALYIIAYLAYNALLSRGACRMYSLIYVFADKGSASQTRVEEDRVTGMFFLNLQINGSPGSMQGVIIIKIAL